jgi:hypothetical protein
MAHGPSRRASERDAILSAERADHPRPAFFRAHSMPPGFREMENP